jgi:hypothetical protein
VLQITDDSNPIQLLLFDYLQVAVVSDGGRHMLCLRHEGHKKISLLYHASVVVTPDVKGKSIPLQAWTRPEGSRKLRLPDFKTIGT